MYLNAIERTGGDFSGQDSYLQDIPAIKGLSLLELRQRHLFGGGKRQRQVHFAGGRGPGPGVQSRRGLPELRLFHPGHPLWLYNYLRLHRGPYRPKDGFFLRAESFYNTATEVEELSKRSLSAPPEEFYRNYGGKSLHHQSHGESFLSLVHNRFRGEGIYLLDEPEAPSPRPAADFAGGTSPAGGGWLPAADCHPLSHFDGLHPGGNLAAGGGAYPSGGVPGDRALSNHQELSGPSRADAAHPISTRQGGHEMNWNKEAEQIMEERFGGDNEMALATCRGNVPSVRTVNATYWEGCFYVITYGLSRKMEEIRDNPTVALSGEWFTCHGTAKSWVVWQGGKQVPGRPPAPIFRQLDRQRPQRLCRREHHHLAGTCDRRCAAVPWTAV